MIQVKVYKNTTLVSFNNKERLDKSSSGDIKSRMMDILKKPSTNLLVDLEQIEDVDIDGLDALMAVQRLSEMNQSQLSLFNVGESVLSAMKKCNLDHYFFFCDRPKPFSDNLLMV